MIRIIIAPRMEASISPKEMMDQLCIRLLDWCIYKEYAHGLSCVMNSPATFMVTFIGMCFKPNDDRSPTFFSRSINNILELTSNDESFYVCQLESDENGKIYDCANFVTTTTNSLLLQEHGIPDEDVPEKYNCALSAHVMDIPVYDPHVPHIKFDKTMITNWLMGDSKLLNPFTKTKLSIKDLKEDTELRDDIAQFVKQNCAIVSRKKISSVSLFKFPLPTELRIIKEEYIENKKYETLLIKIGKMPPCIAKEIRRLQSCIGTDVIRLHKTDDKVLVISQNWLNQMLEVNPKGFEKLANLLRIDKGILKEDRYVHKIK